MSAVEAGRFAELIRRIFERQGMSVAVEPYGGIADLLITSPTKQEALVEVKYFRSNTLPGSSLQNAVVQLQNALLKTKPNVGILATNVPISEYSTGRVDVPDNVRLYDLSVIRSLVEGDPSLNDELDDILRLSSNPEAAERKIEASLELTEDFHKLWTYAPEVIVSSDVPAPVEIGSDLRDRIGKIDKGKGGAKDFEKLCTEALKYVFEVDLVQWKREKQTDTGIHRFDLIARSISDEDFWLSLARDFRSRYIVFEFKNYSDPISQKEIYTTEKYLYPAAMRGTAIIVARNGANDNALTVARGALRESGKLILVLDEGDLFELLEARDLGSDTSLLLLDKLDEMLMTIER